MVTKRMPGFRRGFLQAQALNEGVQQAELPSRWTGRLVDTLRVQSFQAGAGGVFSRTTIRTMNSPNGTTVCACFVWNSYNDNRTHTHYVQCIYTYIQFIYIYIHIYIVCVSVTLCDSVFNLHSLHMPLALAMAIGGKSLLWLGPGRGPLPTKLCDRADASFWRASDIDAIAWDILF